MNVSCCAGLWDRRGLARLSVYRHCLLCRNSTSLFACECLSSLVSHRQKWVVGPALPFCIGYSSLRQAAFAMQGFMHATLTDSLRLDTEMREVNTEHRRLELTTEESSQEDSRNLVLVLGLTHTSQMQQTRSMSTSETLGATNITVEPNMRAPALRRCVISHGTQCRKELIAGIVSDSAYIVKS